MTTQHHGEREEGMAPQLEMFVELLDAYSSTALTVRLLELATGGELTPAQLDTLVFLHRHGGCSTKELSEGLRISIPSATRLVDRLVRKQLVDRRESGVDRRLVQLSLTPTGLAALQAVRAARVARLHGAFATLTDEERAQLLKLLERFLQSALCDEQTVKDCCRHCGTEHDLACVVNEAHIALMGRPVEP